MFYHYSVTTSFFVVQGIERLVIVFSGTGSVIQYYFVSYSIVASIEMIARIDLLYSSQLVDLMFS